MYETTPAFTRAPRKTVLLVVEESTVRELLAVNLRYAGFYPIAAASAQDGCRLAGEVVPDLVFIDLDARAGGDVFCLSTLQMRMGGRTVPTVMVAADLRSACGSGGEVCGATLCLQKPLSPREVVASITRQIRSTRSQEARPRKPSKPVPQPGPMRAGPLELDLREHTVRVFREHGSDVLDLTVMESKLLACFMAEPHRLHTREQIVERVWGEAEPVELRTVDQYVKRLREILNVAGVGALIQTVRGVGYRLNLPLQRMRGWPEAEPSPPPIHEPS